MLSRWDAVRAKKTGAPGARPERESEHAPPASGWNDPPVEQPSLFDDGEVRP